MKRHDQTLLWQYAARELDTEESALVEHHLSECVECKERLLDVRQARLVLQDAQAPRPNVKWEKVDQGISQLVEAQLLRQSKAAQRGWRWPLAFAAIAAAVIALGSTGKLDLTRAPEEAPSEAIASSGTEVEQALGLSRVGAELALARQGERLGAGEVLRTAVGGRGVLALPDGSRMRLAGGSQLALTRTEADDVALTLERGRVGVQASHRVRRGFVVHTNGMSVRVVGTLFLVSQVAGVVEVAVAEGTVVVEPPEGEALRLVGGERVRFERGNWKPLRGAVSVGQVAELNELSAPPMTEAAGVARAPAGGTLPAGAMARRDDARVHSMQQTSQVVGVALTPDPPASQEEGLLPRKQAVPRGAPTLWPLGHPRAQSPANPQSAGATSEDEAPQFEEKASVWPSMGGGPVTYEPRMRKRSTAKVASNPAAAVPQPLAAAIAGDITPAADVAPQYQLDVEPPASEAQKGADPAEFGEFPKAQAPTAASPVAPKALTKARAGATPKQLKNADPLPEDLETLFLQRAERGLDRGICERYLMGLQEIAGDSSRNERAEKARILRARCYDAKVRPDLSEIEYRRYLEVWPKGRHADEARKAIIE